MRQSAGSRRPARPSPGSCAPGKPSRALLSAIPRPLRIQAGAAAPESGPWRAHPDLPSRTGDSLRKASADEVASPCARGAVRAALSVVLALLPAERIAAFVALRGSVACPCDDEFHAGNEFTKEFSLRRSSGHPSPRPPRAAWMPGAELRRCVPVAQVFQVDGLRRHRQPFLSGGFLYIIASCAHAARVVFL